MSQITGKNLATGAAPKLNNAQYLTARNAANSADVNIIQVNASDRILFPSAPQCSSAPVATTDLVNKAYADAITGTGATTSLNNLASTAVNVDIIPGANGTRSLGSSTLAWLTMFVQSLKDASSVVVLDVTNRLLKNTSGTTMLDFSGTDVSLNTRKLTNVVDPGSAQDAATKSYVDSVASNQKTWNMEALTLNGTDITNQYKDLAQVAVTSSIMFFFNGLWQRPTTDYTINYTGGTGGKTRLTFAGDLATGGASELVSSDVIYIQYQY